MKSVNHVQPYMNPLGEYQDGLTKLHAQKFWVQQLNQNQCAALMDELAAKEVGWEPASLKFLGLPGPTCLAE